MNYMIPDGVWPTMITPFTDSNKIDYRALEEMIEWYIEKNVDGLFAVCQSSEMFNLKLDERVQLAKFIKRKVNKIPVIASGHVSDDISKQILELKSMASTGIDALVLVTNRLARKNEKDDIWKNNFIKIVNKIPNISLGFYESPYPYPRLLKPDLLKWCTFCKRVRFLKDTSCDLKQIKLKLEAIKNSKLKIFNANSATLFQSLKLGVSGYSGVMGNFHPELYVWLTKNWFNFQEEAAKLQDFLGMTSIIERQYYPVNAKYFLQLEGLNILLNSRKQDKNNFTDSLRLEVKQFRNLSINFRENYIQDH